MYVHDVKQEAELGLGGCARLVYTLNSPSCLYKPSSFIHTPFAAVPLLKSGVYSPILIIFSGQEYGTSKFSFCITWCETGGKGNIIYIFICTCTGSWAWLSRPWPGSPKSCLIFSLLIHFWSTIWQKCQNGIQYVRAEIFHWRNPISIYKAEYADCLKVFHTFLKKSSKVSSTWISENESELLIPTLVSEFDGLEKLFSNINLKYNL